MLYSISGFSSHFATANFHYQYIGNQTNVPHQYLITLDFYGGTTGVSWPPTLDLISKSTCGIDTTTTIDLIAFGQIEPFQLECAGQFSFIKNTYVDTLVLNPCADWDFKVKTGNRLNYNNLDTNNLSDFMLCFNAKLNNLNDPNSTATAWDPHPKFFCPDKEFYWDRGYTDSDGDSLWITPDYLQGYDTLGNQVSIQYLTPRNLSNPFYVDPSIGYNINNETGDFHFKPLSTSKATVNYLGYKVEEYRKNPNNTWTKVGQRFGETIVIIKDSCHISGPVPFANQDTVRAVLGDTSISFGTTSEFFKFSAVPSDLFILSPILQPVSVKSIQTFGLSSVRADSVRLGTFSPLSIKGIYTLVLRNGQDGNDFIMPCALEFSKTDTLYIDVDTHSYVGIPENESINFTLYPNPAKQILNIKSNTTGVKTVSVFTLSGIKLDAFTFKDYETSLNIEAYKSGVYILQLSSNQNISTQRFIVNH